MKISVIKNQKNKGVSVKNVEVLEILRQMQTEDANGLIQSYRSVADILSSPSLWDRYDRIPMLRVASEYFRKATGELCWRACTGLTVLKVVGLNNMAEVRKVKEQARLMPQTFCALTGADGYSVTVWTLAVMANGALPKAEKEAEGFVAKAYATSVRCFASLCEYEIQIEEPRLDMGCLMTVDPEPYINPTPTPYIISPARESDADLSDLSGKVPERLSRLTPGPGTYVTLNHIFNALYRRVLDGVSGWVPADRPMQMVNMVADECANLGFPQEEAAHRLYQVFARSLDEAEVRGAVSNVYENHELQPFRTGMSKHQLVAYRLREFLGRRYEIRYNEMLQMTEYRERHSLQFFFRELDRRELNTIHHEANIEGIEAAFSEVDELVHSGRVTRYNPITQYLGELPAWDGRDRVAEVAAMVPNSNPNWTRLFRQWLLNMVAHWMNVDTMHANATAPILIGKQGYRKSTFCRMLLPPELQTFFTDSIDFRSNIEAERCLSRFLLVNIDEFDQLSEKQFAFIKHLFQKPQTNIRRMYSESIGTQRRYASFIGTSNHHEVLRDPTGNRRYICVEVTAPIHVEQAINHVQLYAQLAQLINQGERYWLNDEDEAMIRESNRQFEVETQQEQIFLALFQLPEKEEEGVWMSATNILEEMSRHPLFNPRTDRNLIKLGKVLTKLNVNKIRKNDGMKYLLRLKVEGSFSASL